MKYLLIVIYFTFYLSAEWKKVNSPIGVVSSIGIENIDNTLYTISDNKLLYKNINEVDWTERDILLSNEINIYHFFKILDNNLFAGVNFKNLDSNNKTAGLIVSFNRGNTWEILNLDEELSTPVDIEFQDSIYYLLTIDKFYKFDKKFNIIYSKELEHYYSNIEVNNDFIFLSGVEKDGFPVPDLSISNDLGLNFQNVEIEIPNKEINYFKSYTDNFLIMSTKSGLYYSIDFGKNWVNLLNENINVTKFHRYNDKIIYSTDKSDIYYSNNFGLEWFESQSINVDGINQINYIKDKYYFSSFNGIYQYESMLNLWEPILYNPCLIFDLKYSNENLYCLSYNNGIFKTNDFEKWEIINDSLYNNNIKLEKFFIKDSLFITTNWGNTKINISTDFGISWKENNFGVGFNNKINDLCFYNDKYFVTTKDGYNLKTLDFLSWDTIPLNYDEDYFYSINKFYKINNKLIATTGFNGIIQFNESENIWLPYNENSSILKNLKCTNLINYKNDFLLDGSFENRLIFSSNNGVDWQKSVLSTQLREDYILLANYKNNFFMASKDGFYYSINGLNNWVKDDGGSNLIKESNPVKVLIYNGSIILVLSKSIYTLYLSELGIEYTSVEKTEKRNYLYTFPPFPQPTKSEVKINTYWDSALPFTIEDIEIYNLAGIKINTIDKLRIIKETNYNGHIIWDVSNEQAGIYIVYIKHGTESRTRKVMVEK